MAWEETAGPALRMLRRRREQTEDPRELERVAIAEAAACADQPESDPTISFYVRAWHELETDRHIGFGAGLIPRSAVRAWARDEQLDRDAALLLWRVVCHLEGDRAERMEADRQLAEMERERDRRRR